MTRTERRRAEHLARKAEYKAASQNPAPQLAPALPEEEATVEQPEPAKPTLSQPRLNANQANAKLSTGPKTAAGKAISSLNAVRTALTGQTILLPTDDVAAYQELGHIFVAQYKPATYFEELLVQRIIDAEWRLRRIPILEAGIYAMGRRELADSVPANDLDTAVYLQNERHLRNLLLQENRIRRNREKDLKELNKLQADRREPEAVAQKIAEMQKRPPTAPQPAPLHGFEFSTLEITPETALAKAA